MKGLKRIGVLAIGVVIWVFSSGFSGAGERSTFAALDLFSWAFERVREQYVEPVDEMKLAEAAVQGMLASLDPHSAWLSPRDYQAMRTQTEGTFGGLGIEVTMEHGFVKVISPIDGTPAHAVGVQAGDLITHLDGESLQGVSLQDAVERMRGPVGKAVKLTVVRPGVEQPFEVDIVRNHITVRAVWSRLENGGVGYIRISQFTEQTQPGVNDAIRALSAATSGGLSGYVLDLRDNPGGILDQAVAVADDFLDRGLIVSTRGRDPDEAQDIRAHAGDLAQALPIVVLVNGGTASASEIVAGALQDHARAIVMGTRSFGKGSVQRIFPMQEGEGALKLTTQRYYTPSGRSIQGHGVDPDIVVEQLQLEPVSGEETIHEADLRNALVNDQGSADGPAVVMPAGEADAVVPVREDYQLARALDLVRGIARYQTLKTRE